MRRYVLNRWLLIALGGLTLFLGGCTTTTTVGKISITDRFNDLQVPANRVITVTASCNQGEQMVGGGYGITPLAYRTTVSFNYPLDQYPIIASYPSSATSWTAIFFNRTGGIVLGTTHVACVSQSLGVQIVKATGDIAPNTPVTTSCPQNTTATDGGWQITKISAAKDVVTILSSLGSGSKGVLNGWSIKARVARGSSANPSRNQLIAYAVCAAKSLSPGDSPVTSAPITAPPGPANMVTPGVGHVSCAGGQLLTGAGFFVNDIDGNLTVPLFSGEYATIPAQWAMTMESLPDVPIDGSSPANGGGTGKLIPVCVQAA